MNANEVIQAYVKEVVLQLPRRQRNDVAFELHALLDEELQARAAAAGCDADAAMATALLHDFGHPADVAARYRPGLVVVDPGDGHAFLRATVIGLVVIWCAGLLEAWRPIGSLSDLLAMAGQWWGGVVIGSLWWPGVLVAWFGLAAWSRRRWPRATTWTPRAEDRIHGGRTAMVMAILGIACGLTVLFDPRWLLDAIWHGHAAPAAYTALTYADGFFHRQAPWIFALLVLNIPIFATVIANGRWTAAMRRATTALSLVLCAVLAWTVLDGPVFMAPASDHFTKLMLVLVIVFTLLDIAVRYYRRVRPTPGPAIRTGR